MSEDENKPFKQMRKDDLIQFIEETYEATNAVSQKSEELKTRINQLRQIEAELSNIDTDALKTLSENAQKRCGEIKQYHASLFQSAGGKKSVKTEIEGLLKEHQGTHAEWQKKFQELERKIEGLLPGAASAGLASNFRTAKEKIGKSLMLWLGFVIALGALLFIYIFPLINGETLDWTYLFVRLPIGFPLIWLAWYCQNSISQARKLREIYNHKQNIMALYEGFSKSMTDQAKEKLTGGTIDEILVNPVREMKESRFLPNWPLSRKSDER